MMGLTDKFSLRWYGFARAIGALEGLAAGQIRGWAHDPRAPDDRLQVDIVADGGIRLGLHADQFREDRIQPKLCDGRVGFAIPLHELKGARTVRAFAGRDGRELKGSPYRLAASDYQVKGMLEGLAGGRLHGWAFDPMNPYERNEVVLTGEGGRQLRVRADRYRADLWRAGYGDGHFGFSAPARRLHEFGPVRAFAGDGRELPGGPVVLSPAPPVHEHRVGSLLVGLDRPPPSGLFVTGWIIDRDDAQRRCSVAVRHRGRLVAQMRATLFRTDLSRSRFDVLHGFGFDLGPFAAPGPLQLVDPETGAVLSNLRRR